MMCVVFNIKRENTFRDHDLSLGILFSFDSGRGREEAEDEPPVVAQERPVEQR